MIAWIDFAIVPLLLLLAGQSYSAANWSDRYMIWTKSGTAARTQYHLQLCASKGQNKMCGNFTWSEKSCKFDQTNLCISEYDCSKINQTDSSQGNFTQCIRCSYLSILLSMQ